MKVFCVIVMMMIVGLKEEVDGNKGEKEVKKVCYVCEEKAKARLASTENTLPTTPLPPPQLGISDIRYTFGIMYDYRGKLMHGLNRYHLMVGLQIPEFNFGPITKAEEVRDKMGCEQNSLVGNKTIQYNQHITKTICREIWSVFHENRLKEIEYQAQIKTIIEEDLPAILPNYKSSGGRQKRFLTDLLGLAFQGINTYMNYRNGQKLQDAMEDIKDRQDHLEDNIVRVENNMMSLALTTVTEIEDLREQLDISNRYLEEMVHMVTVISDEMLELEEKVKQNSEALLYLSNQLTTVIAVQERHMALYQQLLAELDHFMDALDKLSTGSLSHTVIPPHLLKTYLNHVQETLASQYPEYELIMTEVQQYYDLPLCHFDYHENMVGIQIPLYVKHYTQQPLDLYYLQTVPVPYDIHDSVFKDPREEKVAYTQLSPKHKFLAMSESTTISLDRHQLDNLRY